jgi:hypothetical protein
MPLKKATGILNIVDIETTSHHEMKAPHYKSQLKASRIR